MTKPQKIKELKDKIIQGSIPANKELIKGLGLNAAVLIGELVSLYDYYGQQNKLDKEGYFFRSHKLLENNTGLTRRKRDDALKILKEEGLVSVLHKNGDALRFKPEHEKIYALLSTPTAAEEKQGDHVQNVHGTTYETDTEPCAMRTPNNYKSNYKNKNNNMHIPQESGNGAAVISSDYFAANYNGSTKSGNKDLNKADNVPVSAASDHEILFNELWLLYPRRMGKGKVTMDLKKKIYSVGREHMIRCIDRFKDDMKRQGRPDDMIPYGSTFFNGSYIDYLDENYAEKPTRKPHKITV